MSVSWPIGRRRQAPTPKPEKLQGNSYEDWGLYPEKLREIQSELSDHVSCLAREDGVSAAEEVSANLRQRPARRALAAPHLADQVYATLNRWPTRQEWIELAWLGFWYALIIASDVLALYAGTAQANILEALRNTEVNWSAVYPLQLSFHEDALLVMAWLLQALGRAGFFVTFAYSLVRAWRIGKGVCLARILQLKLIHTLLVVGALMLLGRALWDYWWQDTTYRIALPEYLTAPYLLFYGLLISVGLLAVTRCRGWRPAMFVVLMSIFLWAGGPVLTEEYRMAFPIKTEVIKLPDGTKRRVPSDSPAKIQAAAIDQLARYQHAKPEYEIEHNRRWIATDRHNPIGLLNIFGHRAQKLTSYYTGDWQAYSSLPVDNYKPKKLREYVKGPLAIAGGGLGWLAVPIPFLGLIGLLGMVLIMGRRSAVDALVYSTVCFLAIASTIFPFISFGSTLDLSKNALLLSPFPGFEMLLIGHDMTDSGLLILGLVLSAGVPWLLTGLFLRPKATTLAPPDEPAIAD